ncbi:hypothetical protein SAMN05444162_2387 [Paenibacillaceae bacterium GAS479]|nr:hypothetical protein SAMN05444162_2387 [Paenibacillaceae bacterium GAS479]
MRWKEVQERFPEEWVLLEATKDISLTRCQRGKNST